MRRGVACKTAQVRKRHLGFLRLTFALSLSFPLALPSAAPASEQARMGSCAAFVKRLDERGGKARISRPDLYEGLAGWLAMKARARRDEVHSSARRAAPDVRSCSDFGLAPEPLLALEAIVANVPPARVGAAVESCLAALKVIEDAAASTPGREAAKAASANQNRILVKVLGYLAKDKKPGPGAVESQAESLRKEAAGDLRSNVVFGSALSACGPLGVDVALLARIRSTL